MDRKMSGFRRFVLNAFTMLANLDVFCSFPVSFVQHFYASLIHRPPGDVRLV